MKQVKEKEQEKDLCFMEGIEEVRKEMMKGNC